MKTAAIWAKLNKDLGGDILFRASEGLKTDYEIIDFPSVSLADIVGVWGLPRNGKIIQLMGQEGCGKSYLSLLMAKQALLQYPESEVLWCDSELSFNRKWAESLGVPVDRVIVVSTSNAVEIFETMCGKFNDKGKKMVPGVLDLVVEKQLNISLVVLDSIASLVPPAEENRAMGQMEMAALPRFLPRAFRVLKTSLARANVGMVCINQLRDSMTPNTQPTCPGGRGYRHSLDVSIRMNASTKEENILRNSKKEKIGHMIIAHAEKTRFGPNKRVAEFFLDFTKGVVRQGEELAQLAASYGVVERPNLQMWKYGTHSVRGKDNFAAVIDSDAKMRAEIIAKIKERKAAGVESVGELSDEAKQALDMPAIFDDNTEDAEDSDE